MGKFVEIFFRIIVHIIGQLVNEERGTVSRSEETAGNAVLDKGLFADMLRHDGFAFGGAEQIFKSVNGAACAFGIGGAQTG